MIKPPVWTWEIPVYFFVGGMAGPRPRSAALAELRGEQELARRAWTVALGRRGGEPGAAGVRPRAARALPQHAPGAEGHLADEHRLVDAQRVRPGGRLATANAQLGLFPALSRPARPAAALSGLVLATYTAALVSNTAVPVWSEARLTLPFVFSAGALPARAPRARSSRPSATPARRVAWPSAAPWPRCARPG